MAAVVCTRPGHARSKVVRDGLYGTPGHKRQQYRCTPTNGDPEHRFTPVLPRLCVHGGERCLECEHVMSKDEGPQVPRTYWYSARDITEALRAVGTGMSYIEAANNVRDRANRVWRVRRYHGQLMADWTEVYAPVLWADLKPTRVPERLICDSTPFKVTPTAVRRARRRSTADRRGSSVKAFEVCCVVGADPPFYQPELLALVAVPRVTQAAWEYVLGQLPPGRPLTVLSDEDNSLSNALPVVWPNDPVTGEVTPTFQMCVWHLAKTYRDKAAPLVQRQNVDHPVWAKLENAFRSPQEWRDFCVVARADGGVRVDRWLRRLNRETRVAQQLAATPAGAPRSNRAAEAQLFWLRGRWAGRSGSYRNAERTNRLLQLYVLHRRGVDDPRQYSLVIRRHLGHSNGVADAPRVVTDRGAKPGPGQRVRSSLRA